MSLLCRMVHWDGSNLLTFVHKSWQLFSFFLFKLTLNVIVKTMFSMLNMYQAMKPWLQDNITDWLHKEKVTCKQNHRNSDMQTESQRQLNSHDNNKHQCLHSMWTRLKTFAIWSLSYWTSLRTKTFTIQTRSQVQVWIQDLVKEAQASDAENWQYSRV